MLIAEVIMPNVIIAYETDIIISAGFPYTLSIIFSTYLLSFKRMFILITSFLLFIDILSCLQQNINNYEMYMLFYELVNIRLFKDLHECDVIYFLVLI